MCDCMAFVFLSLWQFLQWYRTPHGLYSLRHDCLIEGARHDAVYRVPRLVPAFHPHLEAQLKLTVWLNTTSHFSGVSQHLWIDGHKISFPRVIFPCHQLGRIDGEAIDGSSLGNLAGGGAEEDVREAFLCVNGQGELGGHGVREGKGDVVGVVFK